MPERSSARTQPGRKQHNYTKAERSDFKEYGKQGAMKRWHPEEYEKHYANAL